MKDIIEKAYSSGNVLEFQHLFPTFLDKLESGEYRSAEIRDGRWQANGWVKKGILLGFKFGEIVEYRVTDKKVYLDKDTFPERQFTLEDQIRLVPGGSSVRRGAHIGKKVIMMPPMYVNVGAYVDDNSLIDSHALVGTCAQIGKHVHLSASAQIGGVIEPVGANPVVIEDNVFVGGNCGIYEGVIVKKNAIIAAGVILTASTPVFDTVSGEFLKKEANMPPEIPENAVVISGSRSLKSHPGFSAYCPLIIKYRDDKSTTSVELEKLIRETSQER